METEQKEMERVSTVLRKNFIVDKKILLFFHLCIIFLIAFIGGGLYFSKDASLITSNRTVLFNWVGNILIIWCLYSWKKLFGSLLAPYPMFLITTYIFLCGQSFLRSLGLSYEDYNLYKVFTPREMLEAEIFSYLGIALMHLGALSAINKKTDRVLSTHSLNDPLLIKSIKIVGFSLFIISAYQYISRIISVARVSITGGYGAIYEANEASSLFHSLHLFFIPASFLLLVVYKRNKLVRSGIVSILLLSVILGYIGGGRGLSTALLISLACLWHKQIKPFKGARILLLLLSGFVLLTFLAVIGDYRSIEDKSFTDFINLYTLKMKEENLIVDSIGEMGGSMFPLIQTMNILSVQDTYKYGATYAYSLVMVFPNFMRLGTLDDAIQANIVSLSSWLMDTLGMTYGPGFSIVAEAYYNFSWFGVFFMFIFGFLVTRFITPTAKNTDFLILKYIFATVILYYTITMVREASTLLIRNQVYFAIAPYVAILLLYNLLRKREGKV